jgi:twinkle protein
MNNFKHVSAMLAQRAEEVARYLLPEGKRKGSELCVGSVEGEAGESLKVCLTGAKAGVFSDFATGDKGDLIDLWALIRKITPVKALKEAEQYLGVPPVKFEAYRPKNFIKPSIKITPLSDQSPVMQYLINDRKLTIETLQSFQIGEKGRSYVIPYVREGQTTFVKHIGLDRVDGKKQIHVTKDCEPCLFGWHMVPGNSRAVRICEGEIDAMSLYQYGLPALSVPFGAGAGDKQKWVEYEFDRLSAFDEIFLCFDMDEKGSQAINELVKRLGRHRCRVVKLPFNDANECLQKGVTEEEMHKCFNEARTLDPEELKPASSYVDEVIGEFYPRGGIEPGYKLPWEKAKGKISTERTEHSWWY